MNYGAYIHWTLKIQSKNENRMIRNVIDKIINRVFRQNYLILKLFIQV